MDQKLESLVFDEKSLDVDTTAWFDIFNNQGEANSFAQLVNSITTDKLVALGVSGDAKNNNFPQVCSKLATYTHTYIYIHNI